MLRAFLQGRLIGHPLHPIIVHFPIGLWVASLVFDIIYLSTLKATFAWTSYYCMIGGLIGGVLALFPGFADFQSIPPGSYAKRIGTTHLVLNLVIMLIYLINILTRNVTGTETIQVTTGQFILSIFGIVLLSISGFLGGIMVYRYGIGHRGERPREMRFPRAA